VGSLWLNYGVRSTNIKTYRLHDIPRWFFSWMDERYTRV
jgi:hypothetical protein